MPDKSQRIGRGMDFVAPVYDSLVRLFFGKGILQAQSMFISGLPHLDKALIIGGGTGGMVLHSGLLDHVRHLKFAELSARMIDSSRRKIRTKRTGQVVFYHGDGFALEEKFDLVVTPFVLDFYGADEVALKIRWMEHHLNENGLWHYSDFRPDLKGARHFIVHQLFQAFGVICGIGNREVVDVRPLLEGTGFHVVNEMISPDGWFETLLLEKQSGKKGEDEISSN